MQALDKPGLITQLILSKLLKPFQTRAFISLCEHHIETNQRYFLSVQQLFDQFRNLVTTPRPAPHFSQTFFVNVDNNDSLVQRLRHRGAQACVVNDVIESLEYPYTQNATGVQQGKYQRYQSHSNATPVLGQELHETLLDADRKLDEGW